MRWVQYDKFAEHKISWKNKYFEVTNIPIPVQNESFIDRIRYIFYMKS